VPAGYLLPCRCGKSVVVTTSQAGQRIACSHGCGNSLEVPTLAGLRKLEEVAISRPSARSQTRAWTPRQQLLLVGVLLAILGGAWAVYVWRTWPPVPQEAVNPEDLAQRTRQIKPLEALHLWEALLAGRAVDGTLLDDNAQMMGKVHEHRWVLAAALAVAGLGIAVAIAARLLPQRQPAAAASAAARRHAPRRR